MKPDNQNPDGTAINIRRGKRLVLLTQWFDPEPAYRGLTFAKDLKHRLRGRSRHRLPELPGRRGLRWVRDQAAKQSVGWNPTTRLMWPSLNVDIDCTILLVRLLHES